MQATYLAGAWKPPKLACVRMATERSSARAAKTRLVVSSAKLRRSVDDKTPMV